MTTPLIIEAAINGSTSPAVHPHVPRTVDEIVADACRCLEAGATIVHHHNDDGLFTGRHDSAPYRAAWSAILRRHPDAILYPTMGGGGPHTTAEERYAHIVDLDDAGLLRMSIVDPGSVSLGGLDGDGLPMAIDVVYRNSFADVRTMAEICRARRLAVHLSIFEPGFLRVALAYHARGWWSAGVKVQLYFGGPAFPFGLPPTRRSLETYVAMLEGTGLPWMVGVMGGDVSRTLAPDAIELGGHVRVGLEDHAGETTSGNVELVSGIAAMAARLGRPVATASETCAILGMRPERPA